MHRPTPTDILQTRTHLALVHPRRSRGKVCTARATPGVGRGWDEGLVAPSSRAISHQLANADVGYASRLRFSGRKHSSCVTGIGAAFQDLDYYKAGLPYAHLSAEEVAGMLVEAYEAAGVPCMSFFTDSGQGGYPEFMFRGMPGDALPRWRLAMRNLRGPKLDADGNIPKRRPRKNKDSNLVERPVDPKVAAFESRMLPLWRLLRDLGVDRGAIDPARVLRVWGAENPKTGRKARLAWPCSVQDIQVVDFDAWCDALMPYTRAELRKMRADRNAWKAANPDYVKKERSQFRPRRGGKWASILDDLLRLLEHRGAAEFERLHMRDLWTLFTATAISVTEGGCAKEWAERLAPMIGLPLHEVEVSLSGVERGMLAHQAGETKDWKGAIREAFYDYSIARIVDELDIGIEEAGDAGLLILVPGGAEPVSDAERQRASRAARGVFKDSRAGHADERLAVGQFGLGMRAEGHTVEQVSYATGVPIATVKRAMKAASAAMQGQGAVVSATVESMPGSGSVPSRSIVVPDPTEPAAALPDPVSDVPAGSIRVTRHTPIFATVETASARWEWLVIEWGGTRGRHEEWRLLTPAASVSADDAELAERARQDLVSGAAKPSRRTARPSQQLSSRTAVAASQTAPLRPLDPAREADVYQDLSGGWSTPRRWHPALVAA